MNIVLSILQVIGWGLLVVLGIIVLAVLVILFCPVRYMAEGDIQESKWAKGQVYWLLHLFRAKVSYEDDLVYGEVGILWKKKTFSYDLTAKEEDEEETEEKETKVKEKKDEQKESIISKIKGIINRIKELYPKIKKMITDERNQQAVSHIKNEILYLIKVILPKQSKIDAAFSTGSPDTTGQLFGVIACFPIIYQNEWKLFPDFASDNPYFKGYFLGKGKIYGYQLVGIVLRILFDKNCTRLYTIIKKFINMIKNESNQEDK